MLYLWLKAVHVGAVLVFLGGLFVLTMTAVALSRSNGFGQVSGSEEKPVPTREQAVLRDTVLHWDRRVTSPALGLVWVVGIALVWMGGWLSSPWFLVKLCFAIFLSAVHGMTSGMIRRMGREGSRPMPRALRYFPAAIVASAVAIAVLVVVKPF